MLLIASASTRISCFSAFSASNNSVLAKPIVVNGLVSAWEPELISKPAVKLANSAMIRSVRFISHRWHSRPQ